MKWINTVATQFWAGPIGIDVPKVWQDPDPRNPCGGMRLWYYNIDEIFSNSFFSIERAYFYGFTGIEEKNHHHYLASLGNRQRQTIY